MSSRVRLKPHPAEQQLGAAQQEIEALQARLAVTEPVYFAHQARQKGRKLTREIRRHFDEPADCAMALIHARELGLLVARPNWSELAALRHRVQALQSVEPSVVRLDRPSTPLNWPTHGSSLDFLEQDPLAALDEIYHALCGEADEGLSMPAPGTSSRSAALGQDSGSDRLSAASATGWPTPRTVPPLDRRVRRQLEREARRTQRKATKGR